MLAHLDRAVAAYAAARQAPTAPAPAPGGEEVPVADGDAVAAGYDGGAVVVWAARKEKQVP